MNRLFVYLLSLLIALLPSVSVACEAMSEGMMEHSATQSSNAAAHHAMTQDASAHDCCDDAAAADEEAPAKSDSKCPMTIGCGVALLTLAAPPAPAFTAGPGVTPMAPSHNFLSANPAPMLRPPIA